MDKKEAHSILTQHLGRFRTRSYAELASWVRDAHTEIIQAGGESATHYEVEIQFFWDDKPDGNVRVLGSISDGRGIRALVPLTDSFILSPEGRFVGE